MRAIHMSMARQELLLLLQILVNYLETLVVFVY